MKIYVQTKGANVTLNDLGGYEVVDPSGWVEMTTFFTVDQLHQSDDFITAIDTAGTPTLDCKDDMDNPITGKADFFAFRSEIGQADGIAGLDSGGKVPTAQLPDSIVGALSYQGTWDASGGTYPGSPSKGYYWVISVAGTLGGVPFNVGDYLIYNGTSWDKVDNTDIYYSSSAPSSPYDGQLWYNTTKKKFFKYDLSRTKWLGIEVFDVMYARNGATKNIYLSPGAVISTASGWRVHEPMTLTAIAAQLEASGTAVIEVRKNGAATVLTSLTLTAVAGGQKLDCNVDLAQGDSLQVYCNNTNPVTSPVAHLTLRYNNN